MKRFILLMLLSVMLLTACQNNKDDMKDKENRFSIYYIDTKTSGMVSEAYLAEGRSKEELIEELLKVIKKDPKNLSYRKTVPDTVTVKSLEINDKEATLIINFETTYLDLSGIAEVLARASIVKTLSQIEGVDYIKFVVNGQPLIDSNGIQIGLMTHEDFIEKTGTEMNYQAVLYFADKDGKSLVAADTTIYYTGASSIEEMVINQLINGPLEAGMLATIPAGTALLNVTTKEGICYVDFNDKFLDANPGVNDKVIIYSIVNSLVELPNITKVQFMINSTLRDSYRDVSDFNGFFERNLEIISQDSR